MQAVHPIEALRLTSCAQKAYGTSQSLATLDDMTITKCGEETKYEQ